MLVLRILILGILYTRDNCTRNTSIKDTIAIRSAFARCVLTGAEDVNDVRGAYAGGTCVRDICIKSTSIKIAWVRVTCVGSVSIGECLEMDLQSFQISEVNLFGTSLKIGVEAVYWLLLRLS